MAEGGGRGTDESLPENLYLGTVAKPVALFIVFLLARAQLPCGERERSENSVQFARLVVISSHVTRP